MRLVVVLSLAILFANSNAEADEASMVQLLSETAARQRDNYDRLKTWRGKYSYHADAVHFRDNRKCIRKFDAELEFLVDLTTDRRYVHLRPLGLCRFFDLETGDDLGVTEEPENTNCVITPTQFLQMSASPVSNGDPKTPSTVISGVGPVGHVILDSPVPKSLSTESFGKTFDPRQMFGRGNPSHVMLQWLADWVGKPEAEFTCRLDDSGSLIVASDQDRSVITFDDTRCRNLIRYEVESAFLITTKWVERSGVYVPSEYEFASYNPDGSVEHQMSLKLISTKVNPPVTDDDFSYKTLSSTNGTRMFNTVTQESTVLHDGEWLSVEDYNQAYENGRREAARSKVVMLYSGIGLLLVALAGTFFLRRRRSKG